MRKGSPKEKDRNREAESAAERSHRRAPTLLRARFSHVEVFIKMSL